MDSKISPNSNNHSNVIKHYSTRFVVDFKILNNLLKLG